MSMVKGEKEPVSPSIPESLRNFLRKDVSTKPSVDNSGISSGGGFFKVKGSGRKVGLDGAYHTSGTIEGGGDKRPITYEDIDSLFAGEGEGVEEKVSMEGSSKFEDLVRETVVVGKPELVEVSSTRLPHSADVFFVDGYRRRQTF